MMQRNFGGIVRDCTYITYVRKLSTRSSALSIRLRRIGNSGTRLNGTETRTKLARERHKD